MTAALKLLAKLVLGYGSIWSLSFGLGMYLFFPMERVRDVVAAQVSAAAGRPVDIGDLSMWRLTGIEAEDVAIRWADEGAQVAKGTQGAKGATGAKRGTGPMVATPDTSIEAHAKRDAEAAGREAKALAATPLRIDRIAARVAVLPYLLGLVEVVLQAEALGGEMSGTVSEDRTTRTRVIDVEFSGLEVGRLPMWRDLLGVPINGVLSGALDLTLDGEDFAESLGKIELKLEGIKVGKGQIPLPKGSMFPFYDLDTPADLGDLDLAIDVGGDKSPAPRSVRARVTRFEQKGSDLSLKVTGDVTLLERLDRSRPNLQVQFKPAAAFVKRAALSMIINNPRLKRFTQGGWIGLHVGGTLGAPKPKLKRPSTGRKKVKARGSKGSKRKKKRSKK